MAMIKRLLGLRDELGFANALLYLTGQALARLTGGRARIESFLLVSQPVAAAPRRPAQGKAAVLVRRLEAGDALLNQLPRPAEVIEDRFRQGAICLAAVKNEQLQGCIWLISGAYDEDMARVRFELPASGRAAWDFDVFVFPQYRLGFTFARLWDAADAYLRSIGATASMSRISTFNAASLASHGSLGARRIGSARFLIIGPLQVMASGLRPYLSVSLRRRPILRLPEAATESPPGGTQALAPQAGEKTGPAAAPTEARMPVSPPEPPGP
jgi:hypothetical protein